MLQYMLHREIAPLIGINLHVHDTFFNLKIFLLFITCWEFSIKKLSYWKKKSELRGKKLYL